MTTQQQAEQFTWLVEYADGTCLPEYDDQAVDGRGWREVEQDRVTAVFLLDPDPDVTVSHRVLIPPDATTIFFRRRLIAISLGGSEAREERRATAHCIGWRDGERGVYLFVFADGSTVLTDNLQAV